MSNLTITKPKTATEKRTRTTVDTIVVTPELLGTWKLPGGQRPLRENEKVRAAVEQIKKDGGVIPGIITVGVLNGFFYIIDGQHRLHAFKLSGLKEGYVDVRFFHAETMRDINREFVELNSKLVTMRPDDFLRGLEESIPALQFIRNACPFVGYDMIRRGNSNAPIVSMAATLRNWRGSAMETPSYASFNTIDLAETTTMDEAESLVGFLKIAVGAFGRDMEYARLWTSLNLVLCMWLFRRIVLEEYSSRIPQLTKEQFGRCLASLSADTAYVDWLFGRKFGERDRSPAYGRIKSVFVKRLSLEMDRKVPLPQPAWDNSRKK